MDVPINKPPRLLSLDAFRGFAMFLMASELMELPGVAEHFPGSSFWQMIAHHSEHVMWTGCSLHDLIQPAFSFMVGVALPFSLGSRLAKGQDKAQMFRHALIRSFILVILGVLLRFLDERQVHWTFEDTLSQIGLGYPFLFLLGFASTRVRWPTFATILVGYWALFAAYPLPGASFDRLDANIPADWSHDFTGFAAHWNLNTNIAWAFDRWFLDLFPGGHHFRGNPEGYSTLSFIPTLGTMILGLIAGQWFRDGHRGGAVVKRLLIAGAASMAVGMLLDATGICPSVKKLWTPSWTLFSGGWCFFLMAAFHLTIDATGFNTWATPLRVLGMNSILMYVIVHLAEAYFTTTHRLHYKSFPFNLAAPAFQPLFHGAVVIAIFWAFLWFLYRRKIFLRI